LTRQGIGVLRFDDRGVGQSTGNHATATSADFATDVQAGIDYLKTRKEVKQNQIGLIGHSEGGLIAPMVASQSDDVGFIVLLAGPGVDGAAILELQSQLIMKAEGASKEEIEGNSELLKKSLSVIKREKDVDKMKKELKEIMSKGYEDLSEKQKKESGSKEIFVNGQVTALSSPWIGFFLSYDPQPALEKTKCPVLALNGEKDLQVDPTQNLPAIEAALKRGGNSNYTIKQLPKMNHLFQTTETGASSEYAKLEETFSPIALKEISDWIKEQMF